MRKLNYFFKEKWYDNKYRKYINIFSVLLIMLTINGSIISQCQTRNGEISGRVVDDINFNALIDTDDIGLDGVKVFLYDTHQSIIATSETDINGEYKFSGLSDGAIYRMEFNYPEEYSLVVGSKDVSEVLVSTCGNNLLLQKPAKFRSKDFKFAMSMFYQGLPNHYTNREVVFAMDPEFDINVKRSPIAFKPELGSVWGLAFSRVKQELFTSAFVKQYVHLGDDGFGAIYSSKRTKSGWKTSLFVDLTKHGIDLGEMTVSDVENCNYGAQVGKIGIGAIALSENEDYLYAVNIHKNELVRIPLDANKFNEIISIPIPNPNCTGGEVHSFALKSYKGKLYVGSTCGAEYTMDERDNRIFIYEYDPRVGSFNEIFTSNYSQGYFHDNESYDVRVQHWITDLDFTDEGNMVIILNDRVGHRYCLENQHRLDVQNGDVLMVWNDNGTWKLERNGRAGIYRGTGANNGEGPGGGEFFSEDCWPTNPSLHPETATGSVFALEGSGEVVVPVYDPEVKSYSGGVKKFNTSNGKQTAVYSIYTHTIYPEMGKASGFGDIDVIYDPLPFEIGDRVWVDADKDGIQDPGEKGISGLLIGLYDSSCTKVGGTKTDENGYYVFNDSNSSLDISEKYYVVIDDERFDNDQLEKNNQIYYLTRLNNGVGVNMDNNDSDASIARGLCGDIEGKPYVEVVTQGSGANNYSIDFGFSQVKIFDLALRKTIVGNSTVHYGDELRFKITVYNQGTEDAHDIVVTDYINSGYDVDPANNATWKFVGDVATYTYSATLKPGASFDVYITMILKSDASLNELVNVAEISSALNSDNEIAKDIDSTPDAIKDNDIGGVPYYEGDDSILITDDLIDDDGTYDEDDQDPAMPKILDLALQKVVVSSKDIFVEGDTVKFKIFVYNQGNLVASKYSVVDYLSSDLQFVSDLNTNWVSINDTTILYEINEELPPFAKKEIEINLIIKEGANVSEILNYSEISNVETRTETSPKDYDSVPNIDKYDDAGGVVGTNTDNQINSSPLSLIADEDDQDVAAIKLYNFDLALVKTALNHNIKEGESITFEVEVYNQGAITADRITIVDYLDTGFVLDDPNWSYQIGDNTKAEITLSIANGKLPAVGLLPNKSVKVSITLLLESLAEDVTFLENFAEIKETYDISGNNMTPYDKDSTPNNRVDNEDDYDGVAVFVRSEIILDPCECLHNASNEDDGQFKIVIKIIAPENENWEIYDLDKFYLTNSANPPAAPTLHSVGDAMVPTPNDTIPGASTYTIEGRQVEGVSYFVTFINNLGDLKSIHMNADMSCTYADLEIDGVTGTCPNSTENYKIVNFDSDTKYSWTITPAGTNVVYNDTSGISVDIEWPMGVKDTIYDIVVQPDTNGMCQSPKLFKVKVGNSSGALAIDDYIVSSVDSNCQVVVTPGVILSDTTHNSTPFEVVLIDPDGNMLPSNIITSDYIGMDIMVKIIDQCSGQRGMTIIKAVDKLKPVLVCDTVEVACSDLTNYMGPIVTDECDPDPQIIYENEKVIMKDCGSDTLKVIFRDYRAIDKWGNVSDVCTQRIRVLRMDKSQVVFPQDYVKADGSALTCNAFKADADGHPLPEVTGTPTYFGRDLYSICTDNTCETTVGYNDFEVAGDGCNCVKKIIRTWHVFENCEGITVNNMISNVQTIEIIDPIPPIPVAPENMLVTTDGRVCSATIRIPELEITDNCSSPDEITVDVFYPGGNLKNSNGGIITLPLGENIVNYKVYDKCGNFSEVDLKVTVRDSTPPIAVCQTNTIVSLTNLGTADVFAKSFDSGSYDACGVTSFKVKRFYEQEFKDAVYFDCNDLDSTDIKVVMKAIDANGNSNECVVIVNVQHKFAPEIECPKPMVVECDFPYSTDDLSRYFGTAVGADVCGVDVVENTPTYSIDQCGIGFVTRSFTATGRGGLQISCTQTIEFVNSNPFNPTTDIQWPNKDYYTSECGDDMFSPDIVGRPVLKEGQCDLASSYYTDQVFHGTQGDACYIILRSWTVVDECQNNGLWNYQQIIHVNNYIDPVIAPLASEVDTCSIDENCTNGGIILEATATDDCTLADDLRWEYHIDLNNDNSFDINEVQYGSKAVATGDYPIGTHSILWIVEDGCGNKDTKEQIFTIKNCTKPSPICRDSIIVELGPTLVDGDTTGIAEVLADVFDAGSYHTCGYPLDVSFSYNVEDTLLELNCEWIKQDIHTLKIYFTDPNGNVDFCTSHLIVQDNGYVCNPFDRCISYPADTTIVEACNPDLDPGDGIVEGLEADGSCGCDQFEVTYSDEDVSDGTNTCQTIARTWDVDFNCDDLDTNIYFVQYIIVKNVEAPELTCPANITVNTNDFDCNAYVAIPVPTYDSDECNTGLAITHNSEYADVLTGDDASGTYPGGTTEIQFTLTDDCGNTSDCNMNVTVNDLTNPLCVPNDTTVALNADGVVVITGDFVASNSTDNCSISTIVVDPNTFGCSDIGFNTVNITVTDNSDNFSVCSAMVEIIDTLTQLCNAHDTILILDENGEGVLDPEDVYSGSGGCGGSNDVTLEVDPDAFNCDDLGENTVQLIVTDNVTGVMDTCEAIVTVVDTIAPQCLVNNDTVYIDDNGNGSIVFDDIDNGSFDPCGYIVDTTMSQNSFGCIDAGIIIQDTVTLTDNNGNTSECISEITVLDTIAPVCSAIDTLSVYLDANGIANINGSDVDDGSSDQCGDITLTVAPNAFTCEDAGDTLDYTLTVTDASGNFSDCGGVILVLDTLTQLCNAHDTILILDENGEGVLDPEDVYSGSGGCGGSNDVTLEVDPDTFNCDDLGENTVQLIVTDNVTGEMDTCEAIVTVVDTIAPQCLVNNDTVYLNDSGSGSISFEDIDNGSFDPCGEIVDTTLSIYDFYCEDVNEIFQDTVTLTDNNGNVSQCVSEITVLDTIAPICNAVDTLFIPLDDTGMAVITGQLVDDGSSDQCEFISLSVEPDTFYCNDASNPVYYELTVTDGSGNESVCSGYIVVQDTTPPMITCPNDTVISCLNVPEQSQYSVEFGEPIIQDNCSQGGDYVENDIVNIDNCGDGLITRNFSITDPSGNSAMCIQIITIEAEPDNFDETDITWPEDTIQLDDCSSIDPYVIGSYPVVNTDDAGCADITTTYEDENLTPGGSCNDTIQRVWTIIDSCKFDADPNTGVYVDTQIVIVADTLAPNIFAPNDTTAYVEDDNCTGTVYMNLYGYVTDCDPNVVVTNDSPYADDNNSADASGYYPHGSWDITITATDQCGNDSIYTYHLNVDIAKYCIKGSFSIGEGDSVIVYVNDVTTAYPDCADMSFSNTNPEVDSMIFYCSDTDENHLTPVYKFDQNGILLDSCISDIKIEDVFGFCSGNLVGIGGVILTKDGDGVENINVELIGNGEEEALSNINGKFEFNLLDANQDYIVSPVKTDDLRNGVNTRDIMYIQKHLLGVQKFNSPYSIIAGDINNNKKITASDILELRKVILGEKDYFSNNNSWRFVKSDYEFMNPTNPLFENYPQDFKVQNLNHNMKVGFVGVKIGDVDNSAMVNANMKLGLRSDESLVLSVDDKFVDKGDYIDVPVKFVKNETISGIQFTFKFENKNLEFVEIADGALELSDDNIGLKNIDNGIFTLSWNTVNSNDFDEDADLFTIRFKVKMSGNLSRLIEMSNDITPKLVFGETDEFRSIDLVFRSSKDSEFMLNQNEPNPWSNETVFKFNLPKAGVVKVKVTNGLGAVVKEFVVEGKEGLNSVYFNKNDINYSGVMFVDFEFANKHMVKRMIKIK